MKCLWENEGRKDKKSKQRKTSGYDTDLLIVSAEEKFKQEQIQTSKAPVQEPKKRSSTKTILRKVLGEAEMAKP